jgi:hypothetical protein
MIDYNLTKIFMKYYRPLSDEKKKDFEKVLEKYVFGKCTRKDIIRIGKALKRRKSVSEVTS